MGIRTIDLKVDDFIGKLKDQISLGSADENTVRRLMRLFEIYLESNLRGKTALFGRFGMPDNLSDVTREPQFQDFVRKSFGESLYEKSMKLMEDQANLYDGIMSGHCDIDWENHNPIDQMDYIQASPEKRMLIEAGPGAGKTWALVRKLLYMTDSNNEKCIDAKKVLVLTFSRAAAAVIRKRLQKEAENYPDSPYDDIQIATIDSFAYSLLRVMSQSNIYNDYVREFTENYENKTRRDYEWYIYKALQALKDSSEDKLNVMEDHGYRFVAVDEVQDINGIRADFILELLNQLSEEAGISALGDPCQAIYDFSQLDRISQYSLTTAVQFFKGLKKIEGMHHYCFTGNHRSNLSMNSNLNKCRPFFTNADLAGITKGLVDEFQGKIKEVSLDDLPGSIRWINTLSEAAGEKSSIAVLVRSNDRALMLFDYFHKKNIPFFWQRRREADSYLAGWIGYFFHEYKDEYIGKDSFISAFNRIFQSEKSRKLLRAGGENPEKYWEALEGCLDINKNERREKYTVEKLLRDLYHNAYYVKEDYRILFSGMVPDEKVILSTVHQAKGREYDYVFLLEDLLYPYVSDKAVNQKEKLNEECRIAYVGMTRPIKGIVQIERFSDITTVRTIKKSGPGNYHLSRFNKMSPIGWGSSANQVRLFEVGYNLDFTPESFAHSRYVQDCIHKLIPIGQPLILKQIYREHYELILNNREDEIPLAENSLTFHDDLGMLVNHRYCNKEWPDQFSKIYANDMITFISPGDVGEGARKFGKFSIWNGIDAVGLGTVESSF